MLHAAMVTATWWLPPDHSRNGRAIDDLFTLIFCISVAVLVGVHAALAFFLVRYRHRKGQRTAKFIHGYTRLEIGWTLFTAGVLTGLAVLSTRVWDKYQRTDTPRTVADALPLVRAMVIGQQFKWNVIYPGPDGVLGRYLTYPKPTDTRWPDGERFRGVSGPAALPRETAVEAINAYVEQINPLGKDFTDPAGADDDWENALARDLVLPVDRPIELQIGSRDVIHNVSIPLLRVKMDAVPGLIGTINFTATQTSDVSPTGYFDLVCQELCGSGHYKMNARLRIVSAAEWANGGRK
jgi:cytochrome c oxidase subunit 2